MSIVERIFVSVFGMFLVGLGVFVLFYGVVSPLWRFLGCIVLCMLGGNAVYGALTGKRPWISEIGSLP